MGRQGQYLQFNPIDDFQLKRPATTFAGLIDIETIHQILDQSEPETEVQQQMWRRDKAILELLYSGWFTSEEYKICVSAI